MGLAKTNELPRIGKYEVLEVLGKGGMGVVYKAIDPAIGRLVAIKMITSGFTENAAFLKRFQREAQSTGKLQHQNIVIVYELGEHDGTPFLVMEFLEGDSLQSFVNTRRAMPLLDKLGIITQTCNGLEYAHRRNVVHRDIKPANLMMLNDGVVKIVDFGIARIGNETMTLPGQVVGSMNYMSPEQIRGIPVDCRTDIFSTAVVLFQLLTYTLPFEAKDTGSTLLKIVNDPPPPLRKFLENYPEDLDYIMMRALAKSREDRYATAEEFGFELCQVQEHLRRELVSDHLRSAEELIAQSELNRAKEQLAQILRVDRQNRRANDLLRDIQRLIQTQQRSEQTRQLRAQADEALAANRADDALKYLEQALSLDARNTELQQMRDRALEAKARHDGSKEALRHAESAQWAGELDEASAAIEKALALDPANSEARALQVTIAREQEERKRQQEIQELLDEAQQRISSRCFTDAIEALKKAEALDPDAPAIRELFTLAASGREQEQKRKQLDQFSTDIQDALNRDDYTAACREADRALERFPNDRGLLKLKARAEKERERNEKRQFVDKQIAQARKLLGERQGEQALVILEAACAKFPTDAALLSLLASVRATLEQERNETRKKEYFERAKDLVRRKDYDAACDILELAHAELNSPDIEDFLQAVKDQAAAQARQVMTDAAAEEAHRLTSAGNFEEAIDFLKAVLQDEADEELEILLADAQRQAAEFNRRTKELVQTAERLLKAGRVIEAVRYLESQAEPFGRAEDFRTVLERARNEQERLQVIAKAVQVARAALSEQNFSAASEAIGQCRAKIGEHPDVMRMYAEIELQRREHASKVVSRAVGDCRMFLLGRSYEAANQLLDSIEPLLEAVPGELRDRYATLRDEAVRGLHRARTRAEADASEAAPDRHGEDTEPQLEWSAPATSAFVALNDNRGRDLDELTELQRESDGTTSIGGLEAISARARSIAQRYTGDREVESVAEEVANNARTRALDLTGFGARLNASPSQKTTSPSVDAAASSSKSQRSSESLGQTPITSSSAHTSDISARTAGDDIDATGAIAGTASSEGDAAAPLPRPIGAPRAAGAKPAGARQSTHLATAAAVKRKSKRPFVVAAGIAALVLVMAFIGWSLYGRADSAELLVQTTPAGATVRVMDFICITPKCKLRLAPGDYKVEASVPGYVPATTVVHVDRGKAPMPVNLTLSPLQSGLRVSANFAAAKVSIDKHESGSLKNGEWILDGVQAGKHTVRVAGADGEAEFTFNVVSAQAPTLVAPIAAQGLSVIAVASLNGNVRVNCNCEGTFQLFMDGNPSGDLTASGRDLGDFRQGMHDMKLVSGAETRVVAFKNGPAPLLQVFLNAERNAGTLILEPDVGGADVYVNGAPYRNVTGALRIPLDAKEYDVRVQKDGYEPAGPQRVQIRKNEETRVSINLTPNVASAFVAIHGGIPGARVMIDRQLAGFIGQDGQFFSGPVEPADHVVTVQKQGHASRTIEAPLKAGEIFNVSAPEPKTSRPADAPTEP